MTFGKGLKSILMALAIAVPVFAENVPLEPLYFEGVSDVNKQQDLWSELMKYKLWGTKGIEIGNRLYIKDSLGWIGTAHGDLTTGEGKDASELGGPVIIGGKIDLGKSAKGSRFLSGPIRTKDSLIINTESLFYGTVCVENDTVNKNVQPQELLNHNYANYINHTSAPSADWNLIVGHDVEGEGNAARNGACSKDSVAFVEELAAVPLVNWPKSTNGDLTVSGEMSIDVTNGENYIDLFYESITFNNDSKLYIDMPENGRLTRIFTKNLVFANRSVVQVRYNGKELSNKDYDGKLLIYVNGNVSFDNMDRSIIQGTYVSTGTISTHSNFKFAGQLIADSLYFGNDNSGDEAFRYVPFIPPVVDIKPEALAAGGFPEDDLTYVIPITLDAPTKTGVSFKYCFVLNGAGVTDPAEEADFNALTPATDKNGIPYHDRYYWCKADSSEYGEVVIPKDETAPKDSTKMAYVSAFFDDKGDEQDEHFQIFIFGLNGAVLPKGSNGLYELTIKNIPLFNFKNVEANYNIAENSVAPNDTVAKILIEGKSATQLVASMEDLDSPDGNPVKLNDLFVIKVNATQDSIFIIVKNSGELDYESDRIKQQYNVKLILKDKAGAADAKEVTADTKITVTDVNEKPDVADTTFTIDENLPSGSKVGTVVAKDPDIKNPKFSYLEYSIITTGVPFEIGKTSAEITVTNSQMLDYETVPNHAFDFEVKVHNCVLDANNKPTKVCLDSIVNVTVKLNDINEEPEIHDDGKNYKVKENTAKGTEFAWMEVTDVDEDDNANLSKNLIAELADDGSVVGGISAKDFFEAAVKDSSDGKTYVVLRVKNALDYESIVKTRKNKVFKVDLTVKDRKGDDSADSKKISLKKEIEIVDVNEKPSIAGGNFDVKENYEGEVATLPASDLDSVGLSSDALKNFITKNFLELKYSIVGVANDYPFEMRDNVIYLKKKLNYEKSEKTYTFTVKVEDVNDATLYDTAPVTIRLKNVDEPPIVIPDCKDGEDCDPTCVGDKCGDHIDDADTCLVNCKDVNEKLDEPVTVGVYENEENGHHIFEYAIIDEDDKDTDKLTVSFTSTDKHNGVSASDLFKLDTLTINGVKSIVLSVKDNSKLDYEALYNGGKAASFTLTITVSDPADAATQDAALTTTLTRVVEIIDVNETPYFAKKDTTIEIPEKLAKGAVAGEVPAKDTDIYHVTEFGHLEYSIVSVAKGEIKDLPFEMNSYKIIVKNSDTLDYEKLKPDTTFTFDVQVKNCALNKSTNKYTDNCFFDTTEVTIAVSDVDEPPFIIPDGCKEGEVCNQTCVGEKCSDGKDDADTCLVNCKDVNKHKKDPVTVGVFENEHNKHHIFEYTIVDEDEKDTDKLSVLYVSSDRHNGVSAADLFRIDTLTINGVKKIVLSVKDSSKLDYEALYEGGKAPTYTLLVIVNDPDKNGLADTLTRIVQVLDVNEPPTLADKTTKPVPESTLPGAVVDTVKAIDPDIAPEYSTLTYSLVGGDTATFKIDPKTGELILKTTLDYEKKKEYKVVVRVTDGKYSDQATVTIPIADVDEKSVVEITKVYDTDNLYPNPDTVYTHKPVREICWTVDGGKEKCVNVNIAKDSLYRVIDQGPTTNRPDTATVMIFYSNASPIVTIEGKGESVIADNIYTVVEKTEASDENLYVNKKDNVVRVRVKDPASGKDSTFNVKISLEPVNVPQKTYDALNSVASSGLMLNLNPQKGETRVPLNGVGTKISYKEKVDGVEVTVSYVLDNDGEVMKQAILTSNGKLDTVEVMTVSYQTEVNGKVVTVSYQANAMTGEVLVKDASGKLMQKGASKASGNKSDVSEGVFMVTYNTEDVVGNTTVVSYSVNEKGKMIKNAGGDVGYEVTYSYTNKYGNAATQSVFIVLDQVGPKVEIRSPVFGQIIRSNFVNVEWYVDGIKQDTLETEGLEKGSNIIVRIFRDKAGNEASDTIKVIMKNGKDVDISVVKPVTEISKDDVEEFYKNHPPKDGETFAVSIVIPSDCDAKGNCREQETLIGGSVDDEKGSVDSVKHLGPTLGMEVKLPMVNGVSGLATLDDLVGSDGLIAMQGVDAENSYKITVEDYVKHYCDAGVWDEDISRINLYDSKMTADIWVYSTIGNFVNKLSFTQELNNPDYSNDVGMLKMFVEMKPDMDGNVRAKNGKLLATGAYLYKVNAEIKSKLRCDLPSKDFNPVSKKFEGPKAKTRENTGSIKSSDELLKPFGYKRPEE